MAVLIIVAMIVEPAVQVNDWFDDLEQLEKYCLEPGLSEK